MAQIDPLGALISGTTGFPGAVVDAFKSAAAQTPVSSTPMFMPGQVPVQAPATAPATNFNIPTVASNTQSPSTNGNITTTTSTKTTEPGVTPEFTQPYITQDKALEDKRNKLIESLSAQGLDIGTIAKRLLSENGSVSSAQNDVQNFLTDAISYQDKARLTGKAGVTSTFDRTKDYALQELQAQRTALLEKSIGGGDVSPIAMGLIDKKIEQSIRDLDSRKAEALANVDAKSYETISGLQLKAKELQLQSIEQQFNRTLGAANLVTKAAGLSKDIFDMATTMSNEEIDNTYKNATIEVSRANSLSDAFYKQAQADAVKVSAGLKGGILDGWNISGKDASGGIAQMWTSRGAIIDKSVQENMDGKDLYTAAFNDAFNYTGKFSGVATPQAVLKTYGFVQGADGLVLSMPNGFLHKDGSITPSTDPLAQPTGNNAAPGFMSMSPEDAARAGYNPNLQQIDMSTKLPAIPNSIEQNATNNYFDATFKANKQSSNQTPVEIAFSQPNSFLTSLLGIKVAEASDGSAPSDNKSFFENLVDSLAGAFSTKISVDNTPAPKAPLHPLVLAIARKEGFNEATTTPNVPQRNNNPGNLKYHGQPGTIGKDKQGFAIFKDSQSGFNALQNQLLAAATGKSKVYSPDMTLYQFFAKYAPKSDKNDPVQYAKQVSEWTGIPATMTLRQIFNS